MKKIPRNRKNSYYKSTLLIRYRTKEKDAVSFSPHVCIKIGIQAYFTEPHQCNATMSCDKSPSLGIIQAHNEGTKNALITLCMKSLCQKKLQLLTNCILTIEYKICKIFSRIKNLVVCKSCKQQIILPYVEIKFYSTQSIRSLCQVCHNETFIEQQQPAG